jgi:hypothetical protein
MGSLKSHAIKTQSSLRVFLLVALFAVVASPAFAAISMSNAPAVRAAAVSGAAPVFTQPSDMTVVAGETADQTIQATDADGDPLTFLKSSGPEFMTVVTISPGNGAGFGTIHLEPGLAEAGTKHATVSASDGTLTSTQPFNITVHPSPVAPVLDQPADMIVNAGETASQALHASDANGDALGFNLVSGPAYVTVSTTDPGSGTALGEIVVAPSLAVGGTATATVGVSDGPFNDQKTLTITVNGVNAAPILAQPADMIAFPIQVTDQQLIASDANGDPVSFSMASGPGYMTVTTVDAPARMGRVRLAPGGGDLGPAIGEIRVTDGVASDQKSFAITVRTEVAPAFTSLVSMSVLAEATADQVMSASDGDGDPLTFSKVTGPAYMTVTTLDPGAGFATGNVHLAPTTGNIGSVFCTVRVSDGFLETDGFLTVEVYSNTDPGSFPAACPTSSFNVAHTAFGSSLVDLQSADLNGDGAPDLVAEDFRQVFVLTGTGTGSFVLPPATLAAGSVPFSGTIADLNGDGSPDLLVSDGNSDSVSVFLGDGLGGFGPKSLVSTGGGQVVFSISTGDFNLDGRLDMVVSNTVSRVSLLQGNGDGTFGLPTSIELYGCARQLTVADLNEDGAPDVIVTNLCANYVSVLFGDGAGGLTHDADYPVGVQPSSIATGDLNGDGNVDVVVGCVASQYVTVYLGNGVGALAARRNVATHGSPARTAVVNMNGDAFPDVATVNRDTRDVSILLGNGTGALGARSDIPVGFEPTGLVAGDFDNDRRTDLAVGESGGLSMLLNGCAPIVVTQPVPPVLTQPADMTVQENETRDQQLTAHDANGDSLTFSKFSGPAYMSVTTVNRLAGVGYLRLSPGHGDVGVATGTIQVTDGVLVDQKSMTITVTAVRPAPVLQWGFVAPFIDPRTSSGISAAVANIIDGKIYVSHGNYPAYYLLSIYDIATDTWTHGGPTAPNSRFVGTNEASGGTALGKHYAMGGGDAEFGVNGHVEEFNPATSTWRTVGATLIPPRIDFGAASWEEKIYAIGGYELGTSRVSDRSDVYDPATDSWRSLARLPLPVYGNFATVAYQGRVYVFGGADQFGRATRVLLIYDIASNTWSFGSPMPTARAYAMAGVISGRIAVFGGNAGGDPPLSVTEIYDPATNMWAAGPDMPTPAAQMARGVTYDGSGVYCIGSGLFQSDVTGTEVMVLRDVSALAAALDLDPNVINLKSRATSVTAYIEPSGFDPASIDIASLRLAGSVPATGSKVPIVGDHNGNGLPDLMVKFGRDLLDPLLTPGINELKVTGSLATGQTFEGSDKVKVIILGGRPLSASVSPNPLNPIGVLTFEITRSGTVSIKLFDIQGHLVRRLVEAQSFAEGRHEVLIDGRGDGGQPLASGVYFYRVEKAGSNVTGRFAVLK